MKNPQSARSATLRGRRTIVLLAAVTLASGLTVVSVRALASDSSSLRSRPDPNVTVTPDRPAVPEAVTSPAPPMTTTQPSPTADPAADPAALADGVYPTFVRAVDVRDATLTVDVLQVFAEDDAHQAAVEDGVPWKDVRYDPVYIRNENPMLRTLEVARDAHIAFLGGCEASNRWGGLTRLREETTPFTETLYYEIAVVGGSITGILQKIAVSAC
ncbi:MAG TPA: hypothetical protein VGZ51_00260 [Actinomycetota bacterium]|nr:hypothetical protein [Actinomycetota bacterium]